LVQSKNGLYKEFYKGIGKYLRMIVGWKEKGRRNMAVRRGI
jgi:hypothetical protein